MPNSRLFVHGSHKSAGYGRWLDALEIHLGWQQMRDGRRTQDFGSMAVRNEANRSDLLGLTVQGSAIESDSHALTYGIDIYHDEVSSSRIETDLATGNSSVVRARFPDGSTLTNVDAYVHDRIGISRNLLLDVGLRLSHARVDLAMTASSAAAQISNLDLSGSAGILYALSDTTDLVANLARGFRAPNIFDLGTLGARPGNRFNIANPDLGPEAVITGDLGLRITHSRGTVEAVIWGSDYQDKIVSVFTGMVDPGGRDIVQSRNASSLSLQGVELSGKWQMGERHLFDMTMNYTHGETSIANQGTEPADRVPPLNGRFGWHYERSDWRAGAQWTFADQQNRLCARDIRDPRINPAGTPGWGVLNLLWSYNPGSQWRVSARMNNVFDRSYRYHGSGIDAAGRHLRLDVEGNF
ncbi:MAG: TonB-dependent receptor [Gammaproteobacteria bacterium]|nr:TonB-dependent receptor [Gammaproteobacteria bacterium]